MLINDGFLRKFIQSLVAFSSCRESLVNEVFQLFVTLGKTKLCRQDLRSVIAIFKRDFLPEKFRTGLLGGLRQIAADSASVYQPSHSLQFPLKKNGGISQRKRPVLDSSRACLEKHPIKFSTRMSNSLTFTSKKGFTVCLWIKPLDSTRIEDENHEASSIHLFGLSDNNTQLDILLSMSAITVSFRDCTSPAEFNRRHQRTATFKTSGYFRMPWNLLAVSFLNKGKFFEVVAMVNGCLLQSLLIPLQNKISTSDDTTMEVTLCRFQPTSKQDSPTSSASPSPICFELASFHVYQETLTTCHNGKGIMLLLLLGPRTAVIPSLTDEDIDVGKKEVLSFFPEHKLSFRDIKVVNLRSSLEENLLFFFTAQHPNQMIMYGRSMECAKRLGGLITNTSSQNITKMPYLVEASQEVENSVTSVHFLFHDLLVQEGGTITVLLLLARIVERGATDSDVAKVLDILFSVVNASTEARRDFLHSDGVNMLARILGDQECDFGFQSVSSILNHCCSSPLLLWNGHRQNKVSFNKDANIIIHCPCNLKLLLLCWDSLKKATPQNVTEDLGCSTLTELVLEGLCLLLRNDHEYSKSNMEIFARLGLAKAVIYRYLEDATSSSEDAKMPLYDANVISKKIVTLYGLLAGSPPNLKMLNEIRNNIMLLLDEEHTFVTVSKSEGFRYNVNECSSKNKHNLKKGAPSREGQTKIVQLNDSLLHKSPTDILEAENFHKKLKQIRDRRQSDGMPSNDNSTNTKSKERSISVVENNRDSAETVGEAILESKSDIEASCEPITDPDQCEEKKDVDSSANNIEEDGAQATTLHHALEHPGKWGEKQLESDVREESLGVCEIDSRDDIICGLLDILYGLVQNLPDASVPHVVGEVLLPEYLIVLCNQQSDKIRERAVWLLWQHVARQSNLATSMIPEAGKMGRVDGYGLAAEQLHKYPTTVAAVNACLSIVHNREVNLLEESPEIPVHAEVTVRASGLSLVLAVLPGACASGDVALAHMLVLHLHELLAKVPGLLHHLLSVGLQEAICKSLRSLATADYRSTDIVGQDSREIVEQVRICCFLLYSNCYFCWLVKFMILLACRL